MKPKIDVEYEEITEYQEYCQKERLKSKWARLEAVVGARERVKQIAKDMVEHFEKRDDHRFLMLIFCYSFLPVKSKTYITNSKYIEVNFTPMHIRRVHIDKS